MDPYHFYTPPTDLACPRLPSQTKWPWCNQLPQSVARNHSLSYSLTWHAPDQPSDLSLHPYIQVGEETSGGFYLFLNEYSRYLIHRICSHHKKDHEKYRPDGISPRATIIHDPFWDQPRRRYLAAIFYPHRKWITFSCILMKSETNVSCETLINRFMHLFGTY